MYTPTVELTDEQQMAFNAPVDRPILVQASPGAGKTRVFSERAIKLVDEQMVDPSGLVLVTFTNKATNEMTTRIKTALGPSRQDLMKDVFAGTLHSFCRSVVTTDFAVRRGKRGKPYEAWANVMPGWMSRLFVETILDNLKIKGVPVDWALTMFSRAKAHALDLIDRDKTRRWFLDLFLANGEDNWDAHQWAGDLSAIGYHYELAKRNPHTLESDYVVRRCSQNSNGYSVDINAGWMDFADMLLRAYWISEDPEALAWWQRRIKYVQVDEYQDTGPQERTVIERFSCDPNSNVSNLLFVADYQQAIYRFRGARPEENVLQFLDRHPEKGQVMFLTKNWRIRNSHLLDVCNVFSSRFVIDERYTKPMSPAPYAKYEDVPDYRLFIDGCGEADYIADQIAAEILDGRQPSDYAILYRTNAQSRAFEDSLRKREVPHIVVGSLGFFGRSEIKAMLDFLRLAAGKQDIDALENIMNVSSSSRIAIMDKYTRFFGAKFKEEVRSAIQDWKPKSKQVPLYDALVAVRDNYQREIDRGGRDSWRPRYRVEAINDLIFTLDEIKACAQSYAPGVLVGFVFDQFYKEWLMHKRGIFTGESVTTDSAFMAIQELRSAASEHPNLVSFLEYADEATRVAQEAESDPDNVDAVRLSTIHKAKGLEFDVVYLTGVVDGLLPHGAATSTIVRTDGLPVLQGPGGLHGENACLFVGSTRAKEELHMSGFLTYYGNRTPVSRDVQALIDDGLIKFYDMTQEQRPKEIHSVGLDEAGVDVSEEKEIDTTGLTIDDFEIGFS